MYVSYVIKSGIHPDKHVPYRISPPSQFILDSCSTDTTLPVHAQARYHSPTARSHKESYMQFCVLYLGHSDMLALLDQAVLARKPLTDI